MGHEARRAPGIPRPIPIDRNKRSRHPLVRAFALGSTASSSSCHRSVGRRLGQYQRSPRWLLLQFDGACSRPNLFITRERPKAVCGRLALHGLRGRSESSSASRFAQRVDIEYDPLYVDGSLDKPLQFQAPSLVLTGDTTAGQLQSRTELLQRMNRAQRDLDRVARQSHWTKQQERSMQLLLSSGTTRAFDLESEPVSVRESYGSTVNAMSLLLARRMVEAGVPFITIFWKENEAIADACKSEGAWDTHGNNFECLKKHLLPEFDRGFAALLADLHQRGLLEQTLVMVTSEMGRKPKIGDPRSGGTSGAGRDHWTHCQSVLLAGGGVRGGHAYGTTDRYGEYPADNPVTPADIAKSVYHAVGIDNLQATDNQGRPYQLLDEGKPIQALFA